MEFSGLTDFEFPSVLQSVRLRRQNPHSQADLTADMHESKTFLMSAPREKICCVCSYWFIDSLSRATVASEWDRLVTKGRMRANGLAPLCQWLYHAVMSDKPTKWLHFCVVLTSRVASSSVSAGIDYSCRVSTEKMLSDLSKRTWRWNRPGLSHAATNETKALCAVPFMSLMQV